jgi:transcriptional regulator with XRE-family HTH domain
MTFGERVRIERKKRGLTIPQLATIAGLSITAIAHTEREISEPTLHTAGAIASAFGVSIDYLMGHYDGIDTKQLDAALYHYRTIGYRFVSPSVSAALDPIVVAAETLRRLAAGGGEDA